MTKLAQPLSADERHHANAAIELASTLVQHARWLIAGFVMIIGYAVLQFILLRMTGRVFLNPLGLVAIIGTIAFFASSPVANAAESIRYRSRRPLFLAIVFAGLCVGITLLMTLIAIAVVIRALLRHDTDSAIEESFVVLIALVLLAATGWMLRVFVVALRAIDRLKAKAPQGFAVITDAVATPSAEPMPYKLPPRPKR